MSRRAQFIELAPTLGCLAAIGWFTMKPGFGFTLLLAVPFLLVWLPHSLYVVTRRPAVRQTQLLKVGAWCLLLVCYGTCQYMMARSARSAADATLVAITAHRERTGVYPRTLADIGVDLPEARAWRIAYQHDGSQPLLAYPSTFGLFDMYLYDFDRREWEFRPD